MHSPKKSSKKVIPKSKPSHPQTDLVAKISRELRTPLNAIIGFAEIIRDERVGNITLAQREYLGDILTSANHLLQLINDTLDLSKIESGKLEFQPEKVLISQSISGVIQMIEPFVIKKHIHLTTHLDKAISTVFIDPTRFKQVIYNYLSTIVQFTPSYGSIHIRIMPHNTHMFRFEIESDSVGICTEDIPKLFVDFMQVNDNDAKNIGTGLGLFITKHIVEAQGGKIGIKSALNKSSTFYAILPKKYAVSSARNINKKV